MLVNGPAVKRMQLTIEAEGAEPFSVEVTPENAREISAVGWRTGGVVEITLRWVAADALECITCREPVAAREPCPRCGAIAYGTVRTEVHGAKPSKIGD